MIELSSEGLKCLRVLQITYAAGEDKIARFKAALQIIQELTPEQLRENLYMDEELLST